MTAACTEQTMEVVFLAGRAQRDRREMISREIFSVANMHLVCSLLSLLFLTSAVTSGCGQLPFTLCVVAIAVYVSVYASICGARKVSARLMVEASALSLVISPNFWPRPLYARPWQFKDRDRQHQNAASQDNLGSSTGKHSTTDPTNDKE